MLAFTGPAEWQAWIDSLHAIERLAPRMVIAGIEHPDADDEDLSTILTGTRDYIRDFRDAVADSADPEQVIDIVTAGYPDYGNPATLVVSAGSAFVTKH